MRPVYQTKFGRKEGNCLAACLASVFEVPLWTVPNSVVLDVPRGSWFQYVYEFCSRFGYEPIFHYIGDPYKPPPLWPHYHLISGISPRGFMHAVVGFNGRIVHDPHPEGGGLLTIADWVRFFPTGSTPSQTVKI